MSRKNDWEQIHCVKYDAVVVVTRLKTSGGYIYANYGQKLCYVVTQSNPVGHSHLPYTIYK